MPVRRFEDYNPQIHETCFIDPSALVIGNVTLGEDCSVWPFTVIRGDVNRIAIGMRSNIQDGTVIHVTHDGPMVPGGFATQIGNDVTVGHKAMLHGCTIGDRVLIGMGATVMDGAVVEADVVIGGGSLVPPGKRLASGYLYVGSPVKQIRELTASERAFFTYTAGKYVELKEQHKRCLEEDQKHPD
ncbi:MAG: gamma carbonic anhydrase family protein [Pseudomonadales bacterium]|nr:gamma carbonic anhydrase family protein [Pseudomonadales bacterium]MCP5357779.1 gamma carbonic anhydrase family protein [Pseudomonadales bacterium]